MIPYGYDQIMISTVALSDYKKIPSFLSFFPIFFPVSKINLFVCFVFYQFITFPLKSINFPFFS